MYRMLFDVIVQRTLDVSSCGNAGEIVVIKLVCVMLFDAKVSLFRACSVPGTGSRNIQCDSSQLKCIPLSR